MGRYYRSKDRRPVSEPLVATALLALFLGTLYLGTRLVAAKGQDLGVRDALFGASEGELPPLPPSPPMHPTAVASTGRPVELFDTAATPPPDEPRYQPTSRPAVPPTPEANEVPQPTPDPIDIVELAGNDGFDDPPPEGEPAPELPDDSWEARVAAGPTEVVLVAAPVEPTPPKIAEAPSPKPTPAASVAPAFKPTPRPKVAKRTVKKRKPRRRVARKPRRVSKPKPSNMAPVEVPVLAAARRPVATPLPRLLTAAEMMPLPSKRPRFRTAETLQAGKLVGAAGSGLASLVGQLLDHHTPIDATDDWGSTALHAAAAAGHHEVVWMLLEYGADPAKTDGGGWTPLMHAIGRGHVRSVELLLEAKAPRDSADSRGVTVARLAQSCGVAPIRELVLGY